MSSGQSFLTIVKVIKYHRVVTMMAKTETLNLRVSPDFKRKLMEAAAQQRRSVTNYLEAVLTATWERERGPDHSRGQKKGPRA